MNCTVAWAEGETVKLTFAPAVENAELSEGDTVTIEASATEEQGAVPDGFLLILFPPPVLFSPF